MSEYGVSIWGAGWVAGEHARAYQANPRTQVVAVGSRTLEGAQRRIREWGIQGAQAYDDLEEMLARDDVAIVSVCTPNYQHAADVVCRLRRQAYPQRKPPPTWKDCGPAGCRAEGGRQDPRGFRLHWHPLFQAVKRRSLRATAGDTGPLTGIG